MRLPRFLGFSSDSDLNYNYEQMKAELFSGKIIKKSSQQISPKSFVALELS